MVIQYASDGWLVWLNMLNIPLNKYFKNIFLWIKLLSWELADI